MVAHMQSGRTPVIAVAAAVVMGVCAGSVDAVQGASQADAHLSLETAGGAPVAGREFVVAATVESRPFPNGPAFEFSLTVNLPSGVAFVSARGLPVAAQCASSGQAITCRSRSIGGEITSNINLTLRAAQSGSHTLRASVAVQSDTDSNPVDNAAQLTVEVGAAPGSTACIVPKVVGKALVAARRAIVKAGCRTGTVRNVPSATVRKSRVIRQSPAAGKRVARGTKVSLVLSTGPRQ
jgi:hypothetical protein